MSSEAARRRFQNGLTAPRSCGHRAAGESSRGADPLHRVAHTRPRKDRCVMSNHQNPAGSPRIALDDIIAAADQGAMRALSARQQAANEGGGVYVDLFVLF